MSSPSRQPNLFPDAPRRKRRTMMHVVDAGQWPDGRQIVRLTCSRCGHDTGWEEQRTVTQERRGRPCPVCNATGG